MAKNKDKVNPLWGGRFEEGANNLTQAFTSSVDIDKALYEVDIKCSIAYAETLKEAKVINQKEFLKIKCPLKSAPEKLNKFYKKHNLNVSVAKEFFPINNFKQKKEAEDFDKAAEDLRLATRHLGMIVGKVDVEEILGSIFNDFCIGK